MFTEQEMNVAQEEERDEGVTVIQSKVQFHSGAMCV